MPVAALVEMFSVDLFDRIQEELDMLLIEVAAAHGALLRSGLRALLVYKPPIFRYPSEVNIDITDVLQATIGCSWNNCTYCQM